MILDNENKNKKVHEWISEYTEEGTFDIVTGYFYHWSIGLAIERSERKDIKL